MESSQTNLSSNFPSFISGFSSRNLDFQMGVIATDTYIALPSMASIYNGLGSGSYLKQKPQADWAGLRDGYIAHSGVYILNALTPNLNSVFVTNATQGISGLGDERPLQSMRTALDSPLNNGFLRPNSFLAIVLLTDEDDFSHDGTEYLNNQYSNPAIHTVQSYVDYLDNLTSSTPERRRYNVHSIAIQDQTCLNQLNASFTGRRIGQRVNAMADATNGIRASLCGNFATQLELIADNIIELSTQFYLSRVPDPATIEVHINGSVIPSSGWYYNSTANSIVFQKAYIPPQGAQIQVTFDPIALGG